MIHITIHVLPAEIDQLENLLIQLKRNSVHLPKGHGIIVEVCLNKNLVDWNTSILDEYFFDNKLDLLSDLVKSWAPGSLIYANNAKTVCGCNDLRRSVIARTVKPYVMYLDVDNIFGEHFLMNTWMFCESMKGEGYHVLTPQTTRMWDETWDQIVNYFHMDEEVSHDNYDVRDPYEAVMMTSVKDRHIKAIQGFKFAGWGTTISTKLARFIGIPVSLSSYGLDDTFIMQGCYIMREKGYRVIQYVIENEVIIENNLFRFNPYRDYIHTIDKREEFLAKAQAAFPIEIQKLKERL